jgi:hypothetical protein
MDWFSVLFGLGFFIAIDRWSYAKAGENRFEEEEKSPDSDTNSTGLATSLQSARLWLVLSGGMAGLAVGTKYTSGILVICGLGVLLWQAWRGRLPVKELLLSGCIFSSSALIGWLPWGLRNLITTGNPFYPLVFPAGEMDVIRLFYYQNHPVQRAFWQSLALPFLATFQGVEGKTGLGASIGPLFLGLGGLAWIGWHERTAEQRNAILTAGWITCLGLISWAVAARFSELLLQARLYFVLAPAAALLVGAGYAALEHKTIVQVRSGRLAGSLILLVVGLNAFQIGVQVVDKGALAVVFGLDSVDAYLSRNLGWFARAMEAVGRLTPQSQVLLLWEPRSLYCLPRCEPDEILDRWVHDLTVLGSPAAVLQSWRQSGYTHILYFRAGANFIREDDPRYPAEIWQALEALLAELPTGDDFGGAYSLISLTP